MAGHDRGVMEETFLDQQELLVHNKQTGQERMKGKRRLLKTVALSMAFLCLGLCVAIPGPTLIDLGRRVNRDTEHMTFIFTARSLGFLIGSLVGGVLFDYFDQQILLFYTLAVVAVATAGVPWCSALLTLSALICLQGVAVGVLDTGGNVFCIKIWGKRSAPFMQVLHFSFGIGAFLAPLIARPFLLDRDVHDNITIQGYHPVTSLVSRSTHNQFERDVFSQAFMNHGYALDQDSMNFELAHSKVNVQIFNTDTGVSQTSNFNSSITPSWHENYFFKGKSRWKKKTNELSQQSKTIFNLRSFDSQIYKTEKIKNVDDIKTQIPSVLTITEVVDTNDTFVSQKGNSVSENSYFMRKLIDSKTFGGQNGLVDGQLQNPNPEVYETKKIISIEKSEHSILKNSGSTAEVITADNVHARHQNVFPGHLIKTNIVNTDEEKELKGEAIVRIKRQNPKINETDKIHNLTAQTKVFGNETAQPITSTLKPSVATVRHFKPGSSDGINLSDKDPGGEHVNKKIKDIKNNLPQNKQEIKPEVTTTIISTDHSLNLTESDNVTDSAQEWNSTEESSVSESSKHTEKITILPLATSSIETTMPTTTTTTATTPTTTTTATTPTTTTTTPTTTPAESTVIKSAATSSGTTLQPIELTELLSTSTTNTSLTRKPKTTGDIIQDLVTSFTRMSKIQIAYPVIGLLLAINSGFFLFLHCKDRKIKSPLYARRYLDPSRNPYTKCFVALIIFLLFLFFLAYMGMEATFGGLLSTFAVNYTRDPWTPAQGASLTSLFWGCLAVGRGFSIFIARCVKPSNMIVMNLGTIVLASLILSIGVPLSRAALWVGTVMLGLGMSSLFPTAILWANSCYPLSSSATAVFVAGCGVGEMTVPLLTGYLYESVSQMAFMYVIMFLSGLLSMLYLSIQMMVYRKGRNSQERYNSGFVRLKNEEEVEDESDLGVVEGISLGIMETTWRRRVHGEEEKREELGGEQIIEFTKLMEM